MLVHWRIDESGRHGRTSQLPGTYLPPALDYLLADAFLSAVRRMVLLVSDQFYQNPFGTRLRYLSAYFTFWKDGLKEVKL